MKQSRWNEAIWIKIWRHNTCYQKKGIKPVEPKPGRDDLLRQKLKENFFDEQPLGKTSGTEAVGQDPRNRTERQNRVGEKVKAKPLGRTFGLRIRRQGVGVGNFERKFKVTDPHRVRALLRKPLRSIVAAFWLFLADFNGLLAAISESTAGRQAAFSRPSGNLGAAF